MLRIARYGLLMPVLISFVGSLWLLSSHLVLERQVEPPVEYSYTAQLPAGAWLIDEKGHKLRFRTREQAAAYQMAYIRDDRAIQAKENK